MFLPLFARVWVDLRLQASCVCWARTLQSSPFPGRRLCGFLRLLPVSWRHFPGV